MPIQQLQSDPSALSRLFGSIGQGLGQGIPQGIDTSLINTATQGIDIQKDPMGYLQALQQSSASAQGKERAVGDVNTFINTQRAQQENEQRLFENQKQQEQALTGTIDQLSNESGIGTEQIAKMINKNSDINLGRNTVEKAKKNYEAKSKEFSSKIKKGAVGTPGEQLAMAKLAEEMETIYPGSARTMLEEAGIKGSAAQAKLLHSVSPKERTAMKAIPSMKKAAKASVADSLVGFSMEQEVMKRTTQLLSKIATPSMSPALVMEELKNKGFSDEQVQDIFNGFYDKLTPSQQEEFSSFKHSRSLIKSLSNIFSKSE